MNAIVIILFILVVLCASTTIFLINEFKKKFIFMKNFATNSPLLRRHYYRGNKKEGTKKGMRNIVLRSESGANFSALIGFRLEMFGLSGFDYYGFGHSQNGFLIFQIYLGGQPLESLFLIDKDIDISISMNELDQALEPTAVYPPHWWQRLGIYA